MDSVLVNTLVKLTSDSLKWSVSHNYRKVAITAPNLVANISNITFFSSIPLSNLCHIWQSCFSQIHCLRVSFASSLLQMSFKSPVILKRWLTLWMTLMNCGNNWKRLMLIDCPLQDLLLRRKSLKIIYHTPDFRPLIPDKWHSCKLEKAHEAVLLFCNILMYHILSFFGVFFPSLILNFQNTCIRDISFTYENSQFVVCTPNICWIALVMLVYFNLIRLFNICALQ